MALLSERPDFHQQAGKGALSWKDGMLGRIPSVQSRVFLGRGMRESFEDASSFFSGKGLTWKEKLRMKLDPLSQIW